MKPEYALEGYTVERIRDEIPAMNTTLLAIDGETVRTLAYNCCDTTAGGRSYVDAVRPLFLAARAGEDRIAADVSALDPLLVPSWAATNVTGAQLIAFAQKAVDAGGLAVFQFHGIGGEWIPVSREAHQELLAWLAANRQTVWTDTFKRVMTTSRPSRSAWPRRAEKRCPHAVSKSDRSSDCRRAQATSRATATARLSSSTLRGGREATKVVSFRLNISARKSQRTDDTRGRPSSGPMTTSVESPSTWL